MKKLEEFVSKLSADEKDKLYRMLWVEYVKQDIRSFLEDAHFLAYDRLVDKAAHLYVYEGKYDCALGYWENIDNVIKLAKTEVNY